MINTARKTFRTIAAHGARAALIGSIALAAQAGAAPDIILPHVHGLTYDASGAKLYVAVHDGLVIYSAGRWSRGPEPRNDYMGFAGTRKQFFSSGHPAPGSGMVNPLGLMQSTDGAQSWTQRGLQGESDFHLLAAGFESGAVYVYNPAPNSKMKQAGIYYTLNQGFAWQHAAGQNLPGKLSALAVHPTDPATVAASTTAGVFLSRDYGARFEPLAPGQQSLGLQFDFDGKSLWFGSFDGKPALQRISLTGPRRESVVLPPLGRDAVAYIAQNPVRHEEIAIATFERNLYVSEDRGKTWKEIANAGKAK